MSNFQRIGSVSNSHVGRAFEQKALQHFRRMGFVLEEDFGLPIGLHERKEHRFDLGSAAHQMIVECKAHTWTKAGNIPSAKITVWNEAMYYFCLADITYKKILFVTRSYSEKRDETLAQYYARLYTHLIPRGVRIIEYDENMDKCAVVVGEPLWKESV